MALTITNMANATLKYPFEFAKTRLQLKSDIPVSNPVSMVRHIVVTDGIRGLYVGCSTLVAVSESRDDLSKI